MFDTHNKKINNNTTTNVEASVNAKLVRQSKTSKFIMVNVGSEQHKAIQESYILGDYKVDIWNKGYFEKLPIKIIQIVYVTADRYHIEYELVEEQEK